MRGSGSIESLLTINLFLIEMGPSGAAYLGGFLLKNGYLFGKSPASGRTVELGRANTVCVGTTILGPILKKM